MMSPDVLTIGEVQVKAGESVTIDLPTQSVTATGFTATFGIDPFTNGW